MADAPELDSLIPQLAAALQVPNDELFARQVRALGPLGRTRPKERRFVTETAEETAAIAERLWSAGAFSMVAIFGSARLAPGMVSYKQAWQVSAQLAAHDWKIMNGGGPGAMKAATRGAGDEHSWNAPLWLPFESLDVLPPDDEKRISFNHFHTRKHALIGRPDAFVVVEGGWGTLDETFEALTLIQTGKRPWAPVVLLEPAQSGFWEHTIGALNRWFSEAGVISPNDDDFVVITDRVDEAAAHVLHAYRNFHSVRVMDDGTLSIRLQEHADVGDDVLREVAPLVAEMSKSKSGALRWSDALPEELADRDEVDLPRLVLDDFDQHSFAKVAALISLLNGPGPRRAERRPTATTAEVIESSRTVERFPRRHERYEAVQRTTELVEQARTVAENRREFAKILRESRDAARHPAVRARLAEALVFDPVRPPKLDAPTLALLESARDGYKEARLPERAASLSIEAAHEALATGAHDIAERLLSDAILLLEPDMAEDLTAKALVLSGVLAAGQGDHERATTLFDRVRADYRRSTVFDDHSNFLTVASSYAAAGRAVEAVELLDRYVSLRVRENDRVLKGGPTQAKLALEIAGATVEKAIVLGALDTNGHVRTGAVLTEARTWIDRAQAHDDHLLPAFEGARVGLLLRESGWENQLEFVFADTLNDDFREDGSLRHKKAYRAKDRHRSSAALASLWDLRGQLAERDGDQHIAELADAESRRWRIEHLTHWSVPSARALSLQDERIFDLSR